MATIKSLFDENLTFQRRVEKVITFSNREPDVLRNEARDYVLTDNLSGEYETLLNYFDDAQSGSGSPECCTWLSGFYGSGKSSFAKYFGLSFDPTANIEGQAFHELFTARFDSPALKSRIKTLTKKYDTAVFLLDLAAQGNSNAGNTPISTLLFDQVCAWAGYASDRKVADLTVRMELDGKLEEFKEKIEETSGFAYSELISQPMLLLQVASELAHEYYPKIWTTPEALVNAQSISTVNDQDRVRQMLDLIEKKAGTRRVLFIVDEVGHFLKNNDDLINNLDGLAKNLKEIGQGQAWLIATAQQTIPKTGPLFGLQDRFPIKIDLKASDIREITHKRLLKKSAAGEATLKAAFAEHGQKLIHSTKLKSCDTYPKLDEASFLDFYPLLPQQFELLINAISSLAKMHGGVGLRSAIRCIEEILINQRQSDQRLIDQEFGALITAADIYVILEKDIVSSAREITLHVDSIKLKYGNRSMEHQVAMTIAVLQQIDGFPASRDNIAALLHPTLDQQPQLDAINTAVDTLLANSLVPVGETDGQLSFLSEVVSQVEQERANIPVTSTHRETAQSHILKELFSRPPKTLLEGTKTVDSGVTLFDGHREQDIIGSDKDIRFLLRLVSESQLEETKKLLIQESLGSQNKAKIYLCATRPGSIGAALEEIHKSDEIRRIHRNHPDQEVGRYLEGQLQLANQKRIEIRQALREKFSAGWFIFHGQAIAVETVGADLEAAAKSKLSEVAGIVFCHYSKAADNVKASVAEAFLKTADISQITSERDPLKLVDIRGTETEVNLQHPALVAVMDFFQRHPNPDGKRIMDEFAKAPYGWMKDTTRYLLASLFYAQKIKLRINGTDELTVVGPQSLDAFKNNSSFAKVTINPNLTEIPTEVRQAAAKRLAELTGESVIPLPQRIAEIASQYLPKFQGEVHSLPLQVQQLGVDTEPLTRLQRSLTEALIGDGAEATILFGAVESEIYRDLIWARSLKKSLNAGARELLQELADQNKQISNLSQQSLLRGLQEEWNEQSSDARARIKDGSFVTDLPALAQKLDELKVTIATHCQTYASEQQTQIQAQVDGLLNSAEFKSLDETSQEKFSAAAKETVPSFEPSLAEVQRAPQAVVRAFNTIQQVRTQVQTAAQPPAPEPAPQPPEPTPPGAQQHSIPSSISTPAELDQLISRLEALRADLATGKAFTLITSN
jgi:hypothetical protein